MNLKDLYIDFFVGKGHKQIPSSPVVPENDPSVLFNTAGMQPLIPYLKGCYSLCCYCAKGVVIPWSTSIKVKQI